MNFHLGVVHEFTGRHRFFEQACKDLGVRFQTLDLSGPDWLDVVRNSGCDGFLVRPSPKVSIWKQMYDERLRVMVYDLGLAIYPTYPEIWFYESKCRMHYWLAAHGIPHPETWVFYSLPEALDFADTATLPLVYKSDFGSSAAGVRIFRKRRPLKRFLRHCFKRGFRLPRGPRQDRQWGRAFLQQYLPNVREWRMIRHGNSYFGHQKMKRGDFHSGTREKIWQDPGRTLLNFTRHVTDTGNFTSMGLDIFETDDHRLWVNELQTIYGTSHPSQMVIDDKPGRYRLDSATGDWLFEEGLFCDNQCCNLRVETFLDQLRNRIKPDPTAMRAETSLVPTCRQT